MDQLRRSSEGGPRSEPETVGMQFSREMVILLVAGLGNIVGAVPGQLEHGGSNQPPAMVVEDGRPWKPVLQQLMLPNGELPRR